MPIEYRDGLIWVSMTITYGGRELLIEKVVIDTGATHSIISPDAAGSLGITYESSDRIVASYGIGGRQLAFTKRIDNISFGLFNVSDCGMDIGMIDPDGMINGLLGLDILMRAEAVIDLKNLLLYKGL